MNKTDKIEDEIEIFYYRIGIEELRYIRVTKENAYSELF
jgi:hypothetical protein